jgi:acyl carrier protein
MIVKEADKEVAPESIADDKPLFGPGTTLELDSIDGLQISMAIQLRYGVRLEDPKEVRRVMASIDSLADFLRPG